MSYPTSQYDKPVHDFLHYDPIRNRIVEDVVISGSSISGAVTVTSLTATTGPITSPTITGTTSVTTPVVNGTTINTNSIFLSGSTDPFSVYTDDIVNVTWAGVIPATPSTLRLIRIGSVVHVALGSFFNTTTAIGVVGSNAGVVPVAYRPGVTSRTVATILNTAGGVAGIGEITVSAAGTINIRPTSSVTSYGDFAVGEIVGITDKVTLVYDV